MGLTVLVLPEHSAGDAPLALTFDAPRIVIGRGEGCEVRLPDPSVSARHASLRQHGGSYLLVDEGSTNGTCLGHVRLAPHAPRVISSGDRIRVGRVWLEVRVEVVAQSSSPQDTRELALMLVQRALEASGEAAVPRVVVAEGPDKGKTLPLLHPGVPHVMGRGHGVDLPLDEVDASRRHAQVIRKAEQVWVRDLGSKNGTWLQGRRLPPDRDIPWRPGEELRIGQDTFFHENPALVALAELERCADEPMAEEVAAALQAPPDAPPQDFTPSNAPVEEPSPHPSPASFPSTAPVTRAPPVVHKLPARSGWGASDVVIILLALGVLILSLGGLFFVFR
ncbi:MAG: FHA domain-containing protein [Myxococcales bacterium]|nr:FHA domain-containing protein [Polyangiaceae bacterium]MDW8250367.1 FHA domain-containing protein [Myxococcales bacterium]